MSDTVPAIGAAAERKPFPHTLVYVCWALGLLLIFGVALGPINNGIVQTRGNAWMQQGRQIGQCMFSYATNYGGDYPDGNSSTEVFQKLLDGGYAKDPSLFYLPLPGKIKPVVGQKLKPENVCWDVTSSVDSNAPDEVPLVFMTGYKVTYIAGSAAIPRVKPYPNFGFKRTWSQWWRELFGAPIRSEPGIAVMYKSNSASFKRFSTIENPDGSIPNFIPANFDPKGKMYKQLTPDGPLP